MRARPHRAAIGLLALALAGLLSACGSARHPADATAENNGYYVKLGPISYQLQVSRELNGYITEDHQYLIGLPRGTKPPTPHQIWYGVFLRAINDGKHASTTADSFDIVDTQGRRYYPVTINPTINQYAWVAESLPANGTEPAPDTTASFGPTQGGLILFKLDTSVYDNRPLTLEIRAPGIASVATISLDL